MFENVGRGCRNKQTHHKNSEKWDKLKVKLGSLPTLHQTGINDTHALPVFKRKPKIYDLTAKHLKLWDIISGSKVDMLERYLQESQRCRRDVKHIDEKREDEDKLFETGDDFFARLNIPLSERAFSSTERVKSY
ncbi:uncharacterized protein LOC111642667 [Centruroides sculpturatus]|uniref:uncharacterized protein LOC111642667 n=1 Tax=Centruroides sculpturatus TaxID=218467 RepID=UPI000C6E8CA1|nr:uncharacterized protein LOC111642667 [Centruroides sculpturatus]